MSHATRQSKRMKNIQNAHLPLGNSNSDENAIKTDQTTTHVEPLDEKLNHNQNKMDLNRDIIAEEPIVIVDSNDAENGIELTETRNDEGPIVSTSGHHNGTNGSIGVSDQDMIFVKSDLEFPNNVVDELLVKMDQTTTTNEKSSVEFSNHVDDDDHWNQQTTGGKPMNLSIEKEVLMCKLVIRTIMNNFVASDLKLFRLVNNSFNDVATKELWKRDSLQVTLTYQEEDGEDDGEFFFDSARTAKLSNYLLNIKKVRSSDKLWLLPSQSLAIRGGNLGCPKIKELFSIIGPTIRKLSLSTIFHGVARTSKKSFRKILLEYAYNIETLQIDSGFNYRWIESEDNMWLYSLKTFIMPNPDNYIEETVKAILRSASNLETLENVSIKYTKLLVETGKVGLVKEIVKFGDFNVGTVADHVNFARENPRLEKFFVNMNGAGMSEIDGAKMMNAVNRILVSSQSSLLDLNFNRSFFGYFAVRICGVNIQKLVVRQSCNCYDIHEKHGVIQLSWNYPSLQYLSFDRFDEFRDQLIRMSSMESLKVLEIGQHTSADLMKLLHTKFPNVKILKLTWMGYSSQDNFLRVAIAIWTELEELEVSVSLENSNILPDLDAAFTGMTVDDCRRIRRKKSKGSQRILNFDRPFPWIGSIKGLKSLKIYFESISEFSSDFTVPLTVVSGLYAFQELPALQVTIGFDNNEAGVGALKNCLEPVFPFVNLVHYSKH